MKTKPHSEIASPFPNKWFVFIEGTMKYVGSSHLLNIEQCAYN